MARSSYSTLESLLDVSGLAALVLAGFGTVGLIAQSGYLLERTVPLGPLPVVQPATTANTPAVAQPTKPPATPNASDNTAPQGLQVAMSKAP